MMEGTAFRSRFTVLHKLGRASDRSNVAKRLIRKKI